VRAIPRRTITAGFDRALPDSRGPRRPAGRGRPDPSRVRRQDARHGCDPLGAQARLRGDLPQVETPRRRIIVAITVPQERSTHSRLEVLHSLGGDSPSCSARGPYHNSQEMAQVSDRGSGSVVHAPQDIGASIASGSFLTHGMLIAPLLGQDPLGGGQQLCRRLIGAPPTFA